MTGTEVTILVSVAVPLIAGAMSYAGGRAAINGQIKMLDTRMSEWMKDSSKRFDALQRVANDTNAIVTENSKEIIRLQGRVDHVESEIGEVKLNCIRTHARDIDR